MPLLSFDRVSIAFGLHPLLDQASFQIDSGERVCLIGRNGAGKSTLLRLVDGELQPDSGEIWREPTLRIARLAQEPPFDDNATVFDAVAGGLADVGRLLSAYHDAVQVLAAAPSAANYQHMAQLQQRLETADGWNLNQQVATILTRLQLPADSRLATLSGGWRRRVALARALVSEPGLLLLDEPTNHLDVEAIEWLEEQLLAYRGAVLFVTHDRTLLQHLATRILELDRGRLTSWPGDYRNFLARKAAALEEETRHNAEFDKKLAQEERWIRQGIKARRTRNEGRVRALEALRAERRARREAQGRARFSLAEAERSGKLVIEAEHIGFAWNGPPLVRDFSVRIMRGDRIGLVGPNGAGKTTLLQLLLGQLTPTTGHIRRGTQLAVAYFDQLRTPLAPEKTVIDNVAEGSEFITVNGARRHIISYLQDFLFTPERARSPVSSLSGGERNRLLLARLFRQPANVLVLDEPTNDLDIETLELLEERLLDFGGTLLLVSHDRAFLDHVVTSTLVFEGNGRISEYVGGYSDWLAQRQPPAPPSPPARAAAAADSTARRRDTPRPAARLNYREQQELAQLPATIEALEAEQRTLTAALSDPAFYRDDPAERDRVLKRLPQLEAELQAAYARWEALESRG